MMRIVRSLEIRRRQGQLAKKLEATWSVPLAPSIVAPAQTAVLQALPGLKAWEQTPDVGADAARMLRALAEVPNLDLSKVAPLEVFSPYPLEVAPAMLARFAAIARALSIAIPALVEARTTDPEVRARLPLSPRIERLLAQITHPYTIGSYRPDVLIGRNGSVRICEINARFPTNGYFVSAGSSLAMATIDPKKHTIDAHRRVADALLARFDLDEPLHVLRSQEKGGDIHLLTQTVEARGGEAITVGPEALSARDGKLYAGERLVKQAVIELHQDELLGLDDATLTALARLPRGLNDLRTIFVAHDKRLFALLSDQKLMKRLVGPVIARTLAETIAETKVVGQLDDEARAAIVAGQSEWVLKPNLFGKGKGVALGKNLSAEAFTRDLIAPDHRHWVLQRFLDPAEIPVVDAAASKEGVLKTEPQRVVGLLLCLDADYFGPGIFRASGDDIVNVARGGSILVPTEAGSGHRWRARA